MTHSKDPDEYPATITAAGPEAIAAWDGFWTGEGIRPTTRNQYRSVVLRFLSWLHVEGIGLREITPQQVKDFLDAQDIALSTKNMYRCALRQFCGAVVSPGTAGANTDGELVIPPALSQHQSGHARKRFSVSMECNGMKYRQSNGDAEQAVRAILCMLVTILDDDSSIKKGLLALI